MQSAGEPGWKLSHRNVRACHFNSLSLRSGQLSAVCRFCPAWYHTSTSNGRRIEMEHNFTTFLYHEEVIWITAFTLGGLLFALGPIAIVYLLMPRQTRQLANKTSQFIECGMDPIGDSWIRYGVVFYLYALIFLAFDVDVLFLFPVAVAYTDPQFDSSARNFIEIILFVGILSLAVVYAWIKGVFKWERKTYLHR